MPDAQTASAGSIGVGSLFERAAVGCVVLVPTILIFAPTALAVLTPAAAVAAVAFRRWRDGRWPQPGKLLSAVLLIAGLWAAASLQWAPEPSPAARKLASLALLIAAGLWLVAAARASMPAPKFRAAFAGGMALAVAVLTIERFGGAPLMQAIPHPIAIEGWPTFLNNYNRGMTVAALLVWPAVLAASRWYWPAGPAVWAGLMGISAFMWSAAATLAVAAGGVVFLIVRFLPKRAAAVLGAAAAAAVLLMPVAADMIPAGVTKEELPSAVPSSAFHRLLIWRFTTDRIFEQPLKGWGFDSSRAIPGAKTTLGVSGAALPLHPHNTALQFWLELGVPGAILGAAVVFLTFAAAGRLPTPTSRAAGAAAATAALTIGMVSYGIWQSWWMGELFLTAALVVWAARGPDVSPR